MCIRDSRNTFPAKEQSTYTAASVVLAADALSGGSPSSGLFTDHAQLPAVWDASDPVSDPASD